jgi:hypothetical protein
MDIIIASVADSYPVTHYLHAAYIYEQECNMISFRRLALLVEARLTSDQPDMSLSAMSKRGSAPTRIRSTKVKKRKGVGSRTITVLDSDEENPPAVIDKYARLAKTRVASSGKAEKYTTSTVQISDVEMHTLLEEDAEVVADPVAGYVVPAVPAKMKKKRKRANDSVSGLFF